MEKEPFVNVPDFSTPGCMVNIVTSCFLGKMPKPLKYRAEEAPGCET